MSGFGDVRFKFTVAWLDKNNDLIPRLRKSKARLFTGEYVHGAAIPGQAGSRKVNNSGSHVVPHAQKMLFTSQHRLEHLLPSEIIDAH